MPMEVLESPAEEPIAARRELLLRIAGSNTFRRCSRLHELLLDIGEHSLAGDLAQLSEQAIGVRLFGRREGYNSADDNIVRVSVRQVRLKLKEYFETEASDEPWMLEIPKGGYIARFASRNPQRPDIRPVPSPPAKRFLWVPVLATLCTLLVAACGYLLFRKAKAETPPEPKTLFSELFRQNTAPVRFVLTDSSLVLMNELLGLMPSVEEYGSREFVSMGENKLQSEEARKLWRSLEKRQITSLADVLILSKLLQENPSLAKRIEARHARHMLPREFKSGNFIITGSAFGNPWTTLFDSSFNFQFDFTEHGIRNDHPQAGEPAFYRNDPARKIGLARVAVLPNLEGTDSFWRLPASRWRAPKVRETFSCATTRCL